jgi:hypothetical protein
VTGWIAATRSVSASFKLISKQSERFYGGQRANALRSSRAEVAGHQPPSVTVGPRMASNKATDDQAGRDWSKFATVFLSSAAVVVSIVSLFQSCEAQEGEQAAREEEREIDVDVDAVASAWRYSRTSGLPVAVSFSNASLRPIIVRRARLWLRDYQLGVAKVYSTEASAVDPGGGAPATPSRYGTTKLPFTMHIREGSSRT